MNQLDAKPVVAPVALLVGWREAKDVPIAQLDADFRRDIRDFARIINGDFAAACLLGDFAE